MKGFVAAEQGHVLLNIYPQGTVVTTALTASCFSMENWGHATILIAGGVGTGTTAITVGECTGSGGTGRTAVTFRYAKEDTGGGDVLDAALALASTVSLSAGSTGVLIVIELDAQDLTDGYPWIQINAASATARDLSIMTVLSGGRYQEDITATALS
jgi:hypothetical protein